METSVSKPIAIKNGVGNTRLIPINKQSIARKNGLREWAKIPEVTSLPRLFLFSPKRSDWFNAFKVNSVSKFARRINMIPIRVNEILPINKGRNESGRIEKFMSPAL